MIKIYIVILLCINSYAYDINKLKEDFYTYVILENIYTDYNTTKQRLSELKKYKNRIKFTFKEKYQLFSYIYNIINAKKIYNDEFLSLVNIQKQTYTVVFYEFESKKLYIIGSALISTGNKDKEYLMKRGEDHYFDTPLGLYEVKQAWRSDGKFKPNKDNIQSYGTKGRFIYYFGKKIAKRYHIFDKNRKKFEKFEDSYLINDTLNFAVHSYNSDEKRGYKNSHGCVRLSDELNLFLEKNLVLHKNFYKKDKWKLRHSHKPKEINNFNIKGSYLLIIDKL